MYISRFNFIFFTLLCLSSGFFLFGQEEAVKDIQNVDLDDLLNTKVTSASKLETRTIEAPSVISVVTREQISDYGWNSINEILYRQPGFGPCMDYDRRTVSSRGIAEGWNNNHILLLVDGVPVNDNQYGTAYTWEITPLTFVRNLEIIRGPGSALYGSNAMSGVVQINSISAGDVDQLGEARFRVGDNGARIYDFLIGRKGSFLSGVAAFNLSETDGNGYSSYDGSGRMDDLGNLLKFTTSDRRKNYYFWGKVEGEDKLKGLTIQFHQQHWQYDTTHGWLWWIPDWDGDMQESRTILSAQYKPKDLGRFTQEYLVRWQRHNENWCVRFYPDNAFGGYYPAGMTENLETHTDDIFWRAQVGVNLPKNANLLFGFEGDRFTYNGDRLHNANVDIDNWAAPVPDGHFIPLAPWLDYLYKHPMTNLGFYGQFTTGDLLGKHLKVTAGLRYDRNSFDYELVYEPDRPRKHRTFSQASPRLAVVFLPKENFAVKFMVGKAFRSPSPTELAGAHTYTLASNIEQLQPEVVTTFEGAMDWIISKRLNWRLNVFHTKFENLIAYSAQNYNLSSNIYTLTTMGLETELLFSYGPLSGFFNYSYAKRLDETVLDETIAASEDKLTWDPAHKVNFGVVFKKHHFTGSVSGHVQGQVDRRASEVGVQTLPLGVGVTLDLDLYRNRSVDSWFTLDANVKYEITSYLEVGLNIKNLFDKEYYLIKNMAFPFDYRQEGRQFLVSVMLKY